MSKFPGGSKSRVNKAGENIRDNCATSEDYKVVETWRASHRSVLNTFQSILRNRTKGKHIAVAQRHKRKNTIFNKLKRIPKMELSRMDDVAGCRLIFQSIKELYRFRNNIHSAKFSHEIKNEQDKYDYIKKPKRTGYRGIHDVYSYDVNSEVGKDKKGLLVEIQYRTKVQHAWATAVELIGFITESQPKFQQGDQRYEECMALASEILARHHEKTTGPFPLLSNKTLIENFSNLESELHLLQTLTGLNITKRENIAHKNMILIFQKDGTLRIHSYKDATDALDELFKLEEESPELDIVLVRADTDKDMRLAFQNYFSDAKDFVRYLKTAIGNLK